MSDAPAPTVEVGVARATAEGEAISGDEHVAIRGAYGLLLAAIDGLGHGAAAGDAAARAAAVLRGHADEPLPELFGRCHAALAETRGAAMTLARIDPADRTLTWLGVGNVTGHLVRGGRDGDETPPVAVSVLLLAGVVGHQLPALRPVAIALEPGDTILLATDGIAPDVAAGLHVRGAVGPLAEGLLQRHRRGRDDALVLLARLLPAATG